jgi:hypothetical protein
MTDSPSPDLTSFFPFLPRQVQEHPTTLEKLPEAWSAFPVHRSHPAPPLRTGEIRHLVAIPLRCPGTLISLPGRHVG